MSARSLAVACLAGLAVALGAGPAGASETFVCADGRFLHVDSSNRAARYQDPCVQAWFARTAAVTPVQSEEAAGIPRSLSPAAARALHYVSFRRPAWLPGSRAMSGLVADAARVVVRAYARSQRNAAQAADTSHRSSEGSRAQRTRFRIGRRR
jgi:hypothetical protein